MPTSILQRLHDDHDRLDDLLGRLAEMLDRPKPPPALELFSLRCDIARLMFAHFQMQDHILYPALLERREAGIAEYGQVLHEQIGELAAAYFSHLDKWEPQAIERDWARYQVESAVLLKRVRAQIAQEHVELYPLLESLDLAA
ncbi:MAG: hemerythrin domain-containing protein [Allosphingosinicella sp.]